jgi:2-oxoisovalerate dehydrogenase E1 component
LHEDTLIGGIGGEIAAWIAENCFGILDAPVMRCASLDTPSSFNIELEKILWQQDWTKAYHDSLH